MPLDDNMGANRRTFTNLDMLADDRKRPDLHVSSKARSRVDNGSRVNRHRLIAHMNSASVATSPATRATPLNFQMLRMVRTISTSSIS